MKAIPYILAVLLLGILGCVWFQFQADDSGQGLLPQEVDLVESQLPQRSAELGLGDESQEAGAGAGDAASARRSGPIVLGEDEESVLVRVVDVEGRAVTGTTDVYVYPRDLFRTHSSKLGESETDLIMRLGKHYRCDPEGETRIRPELIDFSLISDSRNHRGFARASVNDTEISVVARPCRRIAVRVVDGGQQPVIGAVVSSRRYSSFGDRASRGMDLETARTMGPDGVAEVTFTNVRARDDSKYCVALYGLFEWSIEEEVDLMVAPTEPITLVMPPSGYLQMTVKTGPNGMLVTDRLRARVTLKQNAADDTPALMEAAKVHDLPFEGGQLTTSCLALGAEWQVTLIPGITSQFRAMSQTFIGPTVPGETVAVDFLVPDLPTRCVIRGIAVDEYGEPLAEVKLHGLGVIKRDSKIIAARGYNVVTEPDGAFVFGVDPQVVEEGSHWWVTVSFSDSQDVERKFELEFTGRGPDHYDLGVIELLPGPALVSGQVVGPDGKGLAGIEVLLQAVSADSGGPRSFRTANPLASHRSREDGSFAIRGDSSATEFEVTASGAGFESDAIKVQSGQSGVIVQMVALGRLKAQLVEADGGQAISINGLIASLQPSGSKEASLQSLRPNGQIDLYRRAGIYDLVISHSSDRGAAILERKGLVLEAGETLDLGALELKSPKVGIKLTIEANPVEAADSRRRWVGNMRFFEPGSPEAIRESRLNVRGDRHDFFVEQLPMDIEIAVAGFRVQRMTLTKPEETVVLHAGIPLQLRFTGLQGLPSHAIASIALVPQENDGGQDRRPPRLDLLGVTAILECSDPELGVLVSLPGVYHVRVSLGAKAMNGGQAMTGLRQEKPIVITVLDQTKLQTFSIHLDPDEVAATLKSAVK